MQEEVKISIITVVYNAVTKIENTILSVITQDYNNTEYIVIDGGSTDGTLDIIKKYSSKISKFISEKDNGIYDAMNKGINLSVGDWINFINAGDAYTDNKVLSSLFKNTHIENDVSVLYGDAIIKKANNQYAKFTANKNISGIWKGPVFRHGTMFTRAEIHKENNFDLSKDLKICSDFDFILKLYYKGFKMSYTGINILVYEEDGVSNDIINNAINNKKLIKKYDKKFIYIVWHLLNIVRCILIKKTQLLKRFIFDLVYYLYNYFVSYIPFYTIRHLFLKHFLRIQFEENTSFHLGVFFVGRYLKIGKGTIINRNCMIDSRSGVEIGNDVSISPDVHLISGSHAINSVSFEYKGAKIIIDDNVFIGSRATILQGVKIGKGAVVSAGAVVVKDVMPFEIVGGMPAKRIGERMKTINYKLDYRPWFH